MKKLSAGLLALVLGITGATMAQANERPAYLALSYYQLTQDEDRFFGEEDFSTGEGMVRFGGHITSWLAAEWRAGRTVTKEDTDESEYYHRYLLGLYAKLGFQAGPVYPYVLGGYTRGREIFKDDTVGTSKGIFGEWSVGAGVDIDITEAIGINVEYFHVYEIGDVKLSGPGAGLYWRF